ncbi:unnamed protein product [Sphagnum compactum]
MNVAEEQRSSSLTGIISMEYNAAAASYANHHHLYRYRAESDWEEKLQALLQNWQWIDYAVVWKLTPLNRPLEWSTGYFNDRSLASLPNAQRLSYSDYKSCAFTRSSYRCAVKALSQRFPLWWTSDSPRLPTDEPKDQFLQASTIKTIVCLPGYGSDANMYCLELASTDLIMESSELLHALQSFVSGASYVFPGPQLFASNNYGAYNLLGPGGPWSSSYGEPDRSSLRVGEGEGAGGGGGGGSGASAGAVVVAAQAVASGSLELVPGALSGNNLVPGGSDRRIFNPAVAGGSSTTAPPHVNSIPACSFEEEISSSSNLVGVADQWLNAHKFGAVPDLFGSSPSVQVSSTMGTSSGVEEMVALVHQQQRRQQQQQQEVDPVAAGLSSSTSHDGNGTETVSTEMMAHLWASVSDTDVDVEMPGISSIMSRPAFDALVMAFENDPSPTTTSFAAAAGAGADHHMSEAAAAPPHATSTSSCFDSLAVAAAAAGAYGTHADFALHHLLQHGSQQSAASADTSCCNCSNSGFDSPLYSLPPESRGAALSCCNASSVVVPGSVSCLPVDASSLHVDKLILAQRAGAPAGDRNPPAAGVTVVDQGASMNPGAPGAAGGHQAAIQENPFHEQQQQQASSTEDSHVSRRNLSPFQSLEAAANRHSKHPRFDEVSTPVAAEAVGVITAGSMTSAATHESARQPMIDLWKNQLVPRIQQSDSRQRRQLAAEQQPHQPEAALENHHHSRGSLPRTTVQQQQQRQQQLARSCSTIPAEPQTSEVPSELMNFSPGWHDQAHIAHNHKLAERDRRQKFKAKILTLRTIIPSTKKNDKLSVLSNTIEYIRQLKGQITELQKPPRIISSSLQQNLTNPVQAAAPTVAAPGPSTSCNPIINSNTNTSSVVVSVEVGGVANDDSSIVASPGELIIKVQAPKNPLTQTLIQILTQMQDLELEVGSLSYEISTNDQVHISLSVLVRSSDSQQQTSSWYRNAVQASLERALLNHENNGHETSTSTNSDTQMEEQQRVRCNSL